MSTKEQLKSLTKTQASLWGQSWNAYLRGDQWTGDKLSDEASAIDDIFDSMMGSRNSEFEIRVDAMLNLHQCGDESIDNYTEQQDYSSLFRCLGIIELISLNLIDEMF